MPKPQVKPQTEKDWVGHWFTLIEEAGGFARIRFGRKPRASSGVQSEIQWNWLKHSEFDGIGGFAQLLRQTDESRSAVKLPKSRNPAPGFAKRLRAAARHAMTPPAKTVWWREFDTAWESLPGDSGSIASQPRAIAAHTLSHEQTAAALKRAQGLGITLNSLLLWALNRAVQDSFERKEGEFALWMIPVNMRGSVALPSDTANHASYIQAEIGEKTGPAEIHAQVGAAIARGDHWGVWHVLNLGRWAGETVMRWILELDLRNGRAWAGTFSNLGRWERAREIESASLPAGEDWYFSPPVTAYQPLGAGAVTWDGRLSLTLQAHPALTVDSAKTQAWLTNWVARLES